jgi:peptidoglycan hydrolase-like protein with peptidoglycan-binding domain
MVRTKRIIRSDERRRHRWPMMLASIVLLVSLGAVIGWGATAVFAPPRDVLTETPFTFVKLVDGEVGSSIELNTVAEWTQVLVGTNQAAGSVTSVSVEPGAEVQTGSILYSVNLRPIVAAIGETPSFRSLGQGSEGADVKQLQQMLTDLELYNGTVDGKFGARTEASVKAWQKSMGLAGDGVVQAGDVVFLPSLPARISLEAEVVSRGALVGGGEAVVSALSPEPIFTIPATVAQAASMPVGTAVEIQAPDGNIWAAVVAGQETTAESTDIIDVALQGANGAVCGSSCALVPVAGESLLPSTIVTQEKVSGVIAPSAALLSAPDGTVSVIDAEGSSHPVAVVASARGMSVISGAPVGLRVRIPATDTNTS